MADKRSTARKTEVTGLGVGDVERDKSMSGTIKLGVLVASSCFAGAYYQSALLVGALLFATILDAVSDFICHGFLQPPFHDPRPPSQGHTQNPRKTCPYWSAATLAGPAAFGLDSDDIHIPPGADNRDPELRGWKFNPPPESPDKNTLVIMAHGAGRDRRAWLRHTPFLLKAGYTCMSFDFSDHGTSDRADGVTSPHGTTLGLRESRDVTRVVKFAVKYWPQLKIALLGTSTGSVASFIALASDAFVSQHVACLVAENPFSSIAGITWDTVQNIVFKGMLCKHNRRVFLLTSPLMLIVNFLVVLKTVARLKGEGYFSTMSCLESVRKSTTPAFVMHGLADQIVPILHTKQLVAGVSSIKEIWYLPGAGHCQLWDTDKELFESKVLDFLAAHC
eukprot:CAMPEP_0179453304 /NCGR_PEP_ID=MMETSP0799-20121207/37248_1 /TAXON_ID=46947 /ORGANISM="Geminigera cryophila, Strain CCMP2564" /LENGTH=391 /DNA_ID=CAMNT_0021250209 /DNA_START=187 /DNA_END=1362 /DNA_ORIENTATION=-